MGKHRTIWDAVKWTVAENRSLLIVDDDKLFLDRLARAMEQRGFEVTTATTPERALTAIDGSAPAFAVVDLRLESVEIPPPERKRPLFRGP